MHILLYHMIVPSHALYCITWLLHVVVGEKEQNNKTVNVRTRDNQVHGEHHVDDLVLSLLRLNKSRMLDDSKEFSRNEKQQ